MIILYRLISSFLLPVWITLLLLRIYRGKEEISRIAERFGYASKQRLEDQKYIWFHAASVGESLVALTLIEALSESHPNYFFLITTTTITSAHILKSKLPARAIHQFTPIDEYFSVIKFIQYWKPSLAIFIESEIWPNLISLAAKHCHVIIANATMSDISFARWKKYPAFIKQLLKHCVLILCQNDAISKKYKIFHDSVYSMGNLKYSASKPHIDNLLLGRLKNIATKNIILAASTHKGDEEIICRLHINLKQSYPDIITIIAPRHTNRVHSIAKIITSYNLSYIQRTKDKDEAKFDIYLADTMGELALFFSIAKVTIIGGSFKNGGHNIIEPAFFSNSIIFGPDMKNFADIADHFIQNEAAIRITDEVSLLKATKYALSHDMSHMHQNATNLMRKQQNVVENYTKIIADYLQ